MQIADMTLFSPLANKNSTKKKALKTNQNVAQTVEEQKKQTDKKEIINLTLKLSES